MPQGSMNRVARNAYAGSAPVHAAIVVLALALPAFVGCGGTSEPSAKDAADTLAATYVTAGVPASDAEQQCVTDKVGGAITGTDLKAKAITDLSADGREALASAVESCLSPASIRAVFEKVIGSQIGLAAPAATCLADEVATKVRYTALVRQERAAVEAVAKAARKCAQAK